VIYSVNFIIQIFKTDAFIIDLLFRNFRDFLIDRIYISYKHYNNKLNTTSIFDISDLYN